MFKRGSTHPSGVCYEPSCALPPELRGPRLPPTPKDPQTSDSELLKACDDALMACSKALQSKDEVITEQAIIMQLQANEVVRLKDEVENPPFYKNPIFWGITGLVTGIIVTR